MSVISVQGLHADGETHGPSVLDFGTVAVLEELARGVTAVDTEFVPSESTHGVKADLLLLETLELGVVLYLVEFIMIVNASISVPVEDTSQGNVEFACNALGEYQRELYGPQVQVRRAVLDIIVIDFGIGSNDNCISNIVTQKHVGALHAVRAMVDTDTQ